MKIYIHKKIYFCENAHSSLIYNSQNVKTARGSSTGKQINTLLYNGILLSNKKESSIHAMTWVNRKNIMMSERSLIPNGKYYMIPLTCSSRIGKFNLR